MYGSIDSDIYMKIPEGFTLPEAKFIWNDGKLNSFGIQSVGGLAIIADNMKFYWNLCQIENGYKKTPSISQYLIRELKKKKKNLVDWKSISKI